jgi:hypothetical protein
VEEGSGRQDIQLGILIQVHWERAGQSHLSAQSHASAHIEASAAGLSLNPIPGGRLWLLRLAADCSPCFNKFLLSFLRNPDPIIYEFGLRLGDRISSIKLVTPGGDIGRSSTQNVGHWEDTDL